MGVNICLNCLKENDKNICPHCGFNLQEYTAQLPKHDIPPKTELHHKYIVCKVLGESTYGITYQAVDKDDNTPYAIKEFYPFGYATRNCDESTKINDIKQDKKEIFEKGKKQFIEEGNKLKNIADSKGIVKVYDVFEENDLAYIVEEKVDGIKLDQYIIKNGGKIPVKKALEMIKPVIKSLSSLHKEGINHRGICPENIIVDSKDNMKLIGFGASRDLLNEDNKLLRAQLYTGYSPEELYTAQDTAGNHSDIYSISATIYKMITGITPPESLDRRVIDDVKPLSKIQLEVKENVSKAVHEGMQVFKEDRIQTADELYEKIYEEEIKDAKKNEEKIQKVKEDVSKIVDEGKKVLKEDKAKSSEEFYDKISQEEIKDAKKNEEKIQKVKEDIKEKKEKVKEEVKEKKEKVKEEVKEKKEKVKEEVKEKKEKVKEEVKEKKEKVKEEVKEKKEKIKEDIKEKKEKLEEEKDEFDESYPNLKKLIIIILIFVVLFYLAKHFK